MKNLLIIATLAVVTASPSLLAAVYSSASLSNIKYKVVDLNLTDGVEASVDFYYTYSQNYGFTRDNFNDLGYYQYSTTNDLTSITLSDSLNTSSASIQYSDSYANKFEVSGSSLGTSGGDYSYFYSSSADFNYYTLSPNTRLEFTADSNLFVETTSSEDIFEYGVAINYFKANDYVTNDEYNYSDNLHYTQIISKNIGPQVINESKSLSFFIENLSLQESNGFTTNYSEAYGQTNISPSTVPVPAALPLMASALGMFGAARRNKAKKA